MISGNPNLAILSDVRRVLCMQNKRYNGGTGLSATKWVNASIITKVYEFPSEEGNIEHFVSIDNLC